MRVAAIAAILVLCAGAAQASPQSIQWRITKDHWSEADEKGFSAFVAAIGETDCDSSESCMRNPANPYRASDPRGFDIDADCAKWPYMLRAYYAWKNGLPFSNVNGVSGNGDLRFNAVNNHATGRHDYIDNGKGIDGPVAVKLVMRTVFSGTYRTDAAEKGHVLSDFYSPKIQPGTIRPGSAIYDVNGHVGVVYKVDSDGRIYYMDAHPDFSVTRSVYGAQFGHPPARLGGGFKNWRPFRLVGAHRDAAGHLIGGHTVHADNNQIADYSLEQYYGSEPNPKKDEKSAQYSYNGVALGPFEFVRVAMSGGTTTYSPIYELKATMRTLCNNFQDRAQYVTQAMVEHIENKPQPARLPENIYASGNLEWETYSTPSRDARIKAAFAQFYIDLNRMIDMWIDRDPRIVYDGLSLHDDLESTYAQMAQACTVTYLSTQKKPVTLTFDDMMHRLFVMSFDPYHCVELRWGASGDELDACGDSGIKRRWYEAEQRLRNQSDRTYDVKMGFDLDELKRKAPHSGVDHAPAIDIKSLIDNMGERTAFVPMAPVGK